MNNQNYIIHGLKLSDKGLYKCKATSSQGAGTIEKYLHLLLEEGNSHTLYTLYALQNDKKTLFVKLPGIAVHEAVTVVIVYCR